MNRGLYYEQMKSRARQVRRDFGISSVRVRRSDLRRIYREYGIRIDLWRPQSRFKNLRGAYFNDDLGPTVLLDASLPDEPAIFTLGHELKHHLVDRAGPPLAYCDASNENDLVEIGAEVFSAELIFPESEFAERLHEMGVEKGACTAETIVRLKRETQTTLSYAGLSKRAVFLGFACSLPKAGWKKLEETMYGEPPYKRIQRKRRK